MKYRIIVTLLFVVVLATILYVSGQIDLGGTGSGSSQSAPSGGGGSNPLRDFRIP